MITKSVFVLTVIIFYGQLSIVNNTLSKQHNTTKTAFQWQNINTIRMYIYIVNMMVLFLGLYGNFVVFILSYLLLFSNLKSPTKNISKLIFSFYYSTINQQIHVGRT